MIVGYSKNVKTQAQLKRAASRRKVEAAKKEKAASVCVKGYEKTLELMLRAVEG
jgi:hypothetical protein